MNHQTTKHIVEIGKKMTRSRLNPETQLQIHMADYLAAVLDPALTFFWHTPNGIPLAGDAARRANALQGRMGQLPGFPDLCVACGGTLYGLEVKTAKGVLSPEQQRVRGLFNAQGWSFVVVRSLDDLERFLEVAGLPTRVKKL